MAAFVQQRSGWMRTDNLLFPWGCDFEFQNSSAMYHNMDPVRVAQLIQPCSCFEDKHPSPCFP